MKSLKYIKSFLLVALTAGILTTSAVCVNKAIAEPAKTPVTQQTTLTTDNYIEVAPLAVVASPKNYLNKSISMKAKFDKFATLGLDYKPAYKSSDDYISFLIQRSDSNYDIPLSEMKLFLKRDVAEKFIDLKTNDEVEIKGIVFSDALGDAWIDVKQLTITKKAPETDKNGVK